jgi:hypothetical protein
MNSRLFPCLTDLPTKFSTRNVDYRKNAFVTKAYRIPLHAFRIFLQSMQLPVVLARRLDPLHGQAETFCLAKGVSFAMVCVIGKPR